MVFIVPHSIILVTSLWRVILIHYEWCLAIPNLTDVYLPHAFEYKNDVTIRGGTHFIPLSRIDIGALQDNFNWPPRGTWLLSLCHTQPTTPLPIHLRAHPAAFERALSLCEHGNNDDPHLKWWKSNQNRGNNNKWLFHPYCSKATPNHAANHPHRIHIQIGSKSQSGKSTQSITETPPFSFFPFLQSTKCNEIRIYPFIHTIQINHPNAATHASVFHLNSRLNLLSIQPTIT